MAEHVWTVVCHKTLSDNERGSISLIDVVEVIRLRPTGKETVESNLSLAKSEGKDGVLFPVELQLVTWWVRSDLSKEDSAQARVSLVEPGGGTMFQEEVTLEMPGDQLGMRLTIRIEKLAVTAFGRYWFVVEHEVVSKKSKRWKIVARVPLVLEVIGVTQEP